MMKRKSSGHEGGTGHVRNGCERGFADRYLPGEPARAEGVSKEDAKLHAQQIAGSYTSSRRPDSNFMSLVNMLGPVKVVANTDGTITATLPLGAGGAPKKWREAAPYLWQDPTSPVPLAAEGVPRHVARLPPAPHAPPMVSQRRSAVTALPSRAL